VRQLARCVAAGYPHHITQRGHQRQQTFFCLIPGSSSVTFEKMPGRRVENKTKANEDSYGTLVMACQTTLASRDEFPRDIQ
jgi:hypothetical protein